MTEETSWRERAACLGFDTDLWFPVTKIDAVVPMRMCAGCPVKLECFVAAREQGERHGIWGGVLFGM